MRELKPRDWVIYRKQKFSSSPGPRAKAVDAAPRGETYSYVVDKFWIVKSMLEDGRALLVTRTGKEHAVELSDPNLRLAGWWERWRYKSRFEDVETLLDNPEQREASDHSNSSSPNAAGEPSS